MFRNTTGRLQVEALEDRLVPSVVGSVVADPITVLSGAVIQPLPPPTPPALRSNPRAYAKLYLDFDGHRADNGNFTPVFDRDGDRTTFSAAELDVIRDIHARVSEDFAPFNLDVTTILPSDFSNGHALRVAIGGSWRDWYHTPAGGLGPVSAFTNAAENLVWVFSDDASSSRDIADTVSHEAGHGFGPAPQSAYHANGNLLQEYNNNGGSFLTAPIMGNPSRAQYSRWWYGTTTSATTFQDDM